MTMTSVFIVTSRNIVFTHVFTDISRAMKCCSDHEIFLGNSDELVFEHTFEASKASGYKSWVIKKCDLNPFDPIHQFSNHSVDEIVSALEYSRFESEQRGQRIRELEELLASKNMENENV